MRKTTLISALALGAALVASAPAMNAKSGGIHLPVEILPLPGGISVSPAQGIIDLDGSSMTGSPNGASEVTVSASGIEKNIDLAPGKRFIEIFIDGSETPSERLDATKAYVDAMGYPTGGFHFQGKYTQCGTYHITVPKGTWLIGGEESPEFAVNYEITNDYFLYPEPGTYDELTEIELIFPSSFETTYNGGLSFYKERTPNNISLQVIPKEVAPGEDQNTFIIKFSEPVKDPYVYILQMSAGAFSQKWYGPEFSKETGVREIKSQAQILKYYIPEIPVPTIVPAPNSEVLDFTYFTVTDVHEGEYNFVPNDKVGSYLYQADEDWNKSAVPFARMEALPDNASGRTALLTFVDARNESGVCDLNYKVVPPPGNYILDIAAGAFQEFGNGVPLQSSPYSFRYTVVADPTVYELIVPEDTKQLESFEIRFPNATYAEPNDDCAQEITVFDEEGKPLRGLTVTFGGGGISAQAEGDDDFSGASVEVTFEPKIVEKGNYRVEIPKGRFTCNANYASLPVTFTHYVDGTLGLDTVNVDNGKVNVYTPTGVCVLRNADADAVRNLAAGIYIVNGKKVVVK
ncbi:MAG: hypothetical protein NC194_04840 [Prevotella sp.]|nr:hypothetical protein [Prevotella sp.]